MKIDSTGVILYTEKYEETVAFYKKLFNLDTLYVKEKLTCLSFGTSYLMIELDDAANLNNAKSGCREKFCLRFNVENVKEATTVLKEDNIKFDYYEFDWGQLAKFHDPDGNSIGIRSSKEHRLEVKNVENNEG